MEAKYFPDTRSWANGVAHPSRPILSLFVGPPSLEPSIQTRLLVDLKCLWDNDMRTKAPKNLNLCLFSVVEANTISPAQGKHPSCMVLSYTAQKLVWAWTTDGSHRPKHTHGQKNVSGLVDSVMHLGLFIGSLQEQCASLGVGATSSRLFVPSKQEELVDPSFQAYGSHLCPLPPLPACEWWARWTSTQRCSPWNMPSALPCDLYPCTLEGPCQGSL